MKKIWVIFLIIFLVGCGVPFDNSNNDAAQEYAADKADAPAFPDYDPGAARYDATNAVESVYQTADAREAQQLSGILLCSQAPVGEKVTCMVSHAYCSYKPTVKGAPTYCNDAPYPSQTFTLLKWGADWSNFNNRCLIVTGYISLYKGLPQIEATNISQVQNCP